MICPRCGAENPDDALACSSCGAALDREPAAAAEEAEVEGPLAGPPAEGAHEEAAPPAPPPRYGPAARLALGRGALAFGIMLLLGLILAVIAPGAEEMSIPDTLKLGVLQFYSFHRVAVRVDFPTLDLGQLQDEVAGPAGFDFGLQLSASAALAMMLATALAAWLLYRGGRAVARAVGGRPLHGLLAGPVVAVPYALLSLVFALVSVIGVGLPPEAGVAGELRVAAAPVSAFLWPLVIGAAAALVGSFGVVRHELVPAPHRPRVLAALGGGWRMLGWALAVAFVGLFWLSATNPDTFRAYFRFVGELPAREGISIVVTTALVVPNLMTGLLFLGMGASVVADMALGPFSLSVPVSLLRWPDVDPALLEGVDPFAGGGMPQLPFTHGIGPADWFFFVLAPLVGVLVGGRWAARRAGETSAGGAAAVGALAGVPFAVGCLALAILASIGMRLDHNVPFFAGGDLRIGPSLVLGPLIALAWGAVGGAVGGTLGRRRPDAPAVGAEPPTTGPPPG